MSQLLQSSQSINISIDAGGSLAVAPFKGNYTLLGTGGSVYGSAIATNATVSAVYGPYSDSVSMRLTVSDGGLVDFEAGASPTLDAKPPQSQQISISANRTIVAEDDGLVFACTTALTITIPSALSPRPNIAVIPPASGNVSIAVSGGANINGATTTLTRARAANPAGFVITPYSESDGYGVSGS